MKNRGFYVNSSQGQDPEKINLFIQIDQFISYLQDQKSKGLDWIKFDIYKNRPGSKLSHNIKQINAKDHE
jgi:hypothetical protein